MKILTVKDLYLFVIVILIRTNWALSLKPSSALAKALAFIAYHLSATKRRLCEKNLSEAFDGKLSEDRVRAIIKSSFCQIWQETFWIPSPKRPTVALMKLEFLGLEHLRGAIGQGKGAILWESSCFGRRLLAKQVLHNNGFAVDQVHGENHLGGFGHARGPSSRTQDFFRRFFENCEKPFVREILYLRRRSSPALSKALGERLRQNGIICISADARRGRKFVAVSILGHTLFFPTAMVSLAKLNGAAILPLFCIQESEETARFIIEPPIPIDHDEDRERCLELAILRYASLLESYIQQYPEQYRNWSFSEGEV